MEKALDQNEDDPIKVLDLLIHLNEINVQKFNDIDFDEHYGEIILITNWGKITFEYSHDDSHEPTGEGDYDIWVVYEFTKDSSAYELVLRGNSRLNRNGEHEVGEYSEVTNLRKIK